MGRRGKVPEGEHTYMPDLGCNLAPSCLACPLPVCKYDDGGTSAQRQLRQEGDRRVAMAVESGSTVKEVAERFGMTQRTVFRALRRVSLENSQ